MLKYHESEGIIDSFSKNHTTPYSAVALQEMNLFHFYPSIYWICACLTVDAKATDDELSNDEIEGETLLELEENSYTNETDETNDNEDIDDSDEDLEETEEELEESELINNLSVKPKKRKQSTDYGKIAKAIGNLLSTTKISMELPDINKADLEFSPDVENNAIMFGLKGISGINEEFLKEALSKRPYTSIEDFYIRNNPKMGQMLSLIKAGCFDSLEKSDRINTMRKFLLHIANEKISFKTKLTMVDFNKMADLEKIPNELKKAKQMYFFKTWLLMQPNGTSNENVIIKVEDEQGHKFFKNKCVPEYNPRSKKTTHIETEDGIVVYKKPFGTMYDKYMKNLTEEWLKKEETQTYYNHILKEQHIQELWEKYCKGSVSKWEMESLNYYYHKHELEHVDIEKYKIDSFYNLPEEPYVIQYKPNKQGKVYPEYRLNRIVGTVLDKNKNKHTVSLLTTDGVVTIKFYDGLFNFYNKTIKKKMIVKGKEKNVTIEKPWFTRGNKLVINGIRRGDSFFPKKAYNSDYLSRHTVALIYSIDDFGNMELQLERERGD